MAALGAATPSRPAAVLAPSAARAPEAPAVKCEKVSVRFVSERRTVTALYNVSFSLERGGFLSLLGPSGCGKSTLLRVVADLIAPSTGSVSVLGMSPRQARQERSLGFVFQEAALLPWRTALENVELPLEVGGFRRLRCDDPTPRELLKLRRPRGLGTKLSARTFRRHAPTGFDRARAARRSASVTDGRAVRRAR